MLQELPAKLICFFEISYFANKLHVFLSIRREMGFPLLESRQIHQDSLWVYRRNTLLRGTFKYDF